MLSRNGLEHGWFGYSIDIRKHVWAFVLMDEIATVTRPVRSWGGRPKGIKKERRVRKADRDSPW